MSRHVARLDDIAVASAIDLIAHHIVAVDHATSFGRNNQHTVSGRLAGNLKLVSANCVASHSEPGRVAAESFDGGVAEEPPGNNSRICLGNENEGDWILFKGSNRRAPVIFDE